MNVDDLMKTFESMFKAGEILDSIDGNAHIEYKGPGQYAGSPNYQHLKDKKVFIVDSQYAETLGDIQLFPEVILAILNCADEADIATSMEGKLKEYLKQNNDSNTYPNLFTYESYYAAIVRSYLQKRKSG